MEIKKSQGITATEKLLADLCEQSFLKLWSYPNPCKDDGKELCDLIVVFEDTVLIFFDRESNRLRQSHSDLPTAWRRWKKEVVDKQITTSRGAERYIRSGREVFLDPSRTLTLPVPIDPTVVRVHKIVVAHGAKEACLAQSPDNVSGSLAIGYGDVPSEEDDPFFVHLDRDDPVHLLDSENLSIILTELDTIYDFVSYLDAKVEAIKRHRLVCYCGEEDVLAHYLGQYDKKTKKHWIGAEPKFDWVHIGEGEWKGFAASSVYQTRKRADEPSYLWDRLIQITSENALAGTLQGSGDPFRQRSAIHWMAKEPRFVRRELANKILEAMHRFPENDAPIVRYVTLMPAFHDDRARYVFLQLKVTNKGDYETEYRPRRQALLEIACGAAKLKWPEINRVIGIAIDAPKYAGDINSEDLAVMEFDEWDETIADQYRELNRDIKFFETGTMRQTRKRFREFPSVRSDRPRRRKIGRNELCPCGSGKKYKRCHGRSNGAAT